MNLYKLILLLAGICAGMFHHARAQAPDSLLTDRQEKFQDYSTFRKEMKERSWINMVELDRKASALVNTDNELIWGYLNKEITRNQQLSTQNDRMKLEMTFLKREIETRTQQLNDHQHLNNLFLMIILGLSVACIVSLVLLIGQFKRNRQASKELERMWSMSDDQTTSLRKQEKELARQIRLLEVENQAMQKELALLSDQKSAARRKLEEEIRSRQKAEQEIKVLIGQIKKK